MCIITTHAIFISSTKQNIMNTDSKLKRFIVLLDKAPFVLFLESERYLPHADNLIPVLNRFNLSFTDTLVTAPILPNQDLRKIVAATNTLEDPLAYNIIEALADALPSHIDHFPVYFPVHFFTASFWQMYIEWQNVDKPASATPSSHFTITVNRITHELDIMPSDELKYSEKSYDGVIDLYSVNITVPFPKALLKECTADIYEIIKVMSMNREPETVAKSKYMTVVMNTRGHDTFNWVNLKGIEKDLIAVIKIAGITIEE